jgi:hypothetical protein
VRALQADADLFAGSYEQALEAFRSYNSSTESSGRAYEWLLKEMILTEFEARGIGEQERNTDRAQELAGTQPASSETETRETLNRALAADALEPLAWFNLGHVAETRHIDEATRAFTAAAVLSEWDAQAWAFAFFCAAMGTSPPALLPALIETGERLTSGQMVPVLIDLIRDQDKDFPHDPMLRLVNGLVAETEDDSGGFQLRLLRDGGQVETLQLPAVPARKNPTIRASAKVGRNDSCPCGSGRKYKKCCG